MKLALILFIVLNCYSPITFAQQVIKVNGKYGAIEGGTTILNPIYDTVYKPNEDDYSFYIFSKGKKYGYHITYGCEGCFEKVTYETSEIIYDTIYKNYKNYILEKNGKFKFKSIKHFAEFAEHGWNRPVRYQLEHFENDESEWYDSIIVDRKIQKITNLEDVLLLNNKGLYGLFTRYGGGENVHGSVTECLWDSIQPITTYPIFMAWKDGKVHYLNAITNRYTSEAFQPGELEVFWDPMVVIQHNKPIRYFDQNTMMYLYTIEGENGSLIRDTALLYLIYSESYNLSNIDNPNRKQEIERSIVRVHSKLKFVENNNPYELTSLKHSFFANSPFKMCIQLFINEINGGKNILAFNNKNHLYKIVNSEMTFDPILEYDLCSKDQNNIPLVVYSSKDGKMIEEFEYPGYYIHFYDGKFSAIKSKRLAKKFHYNDTIERIDIQFDKVNVPSKTIGYYSFNKKKYEYEIVRFKWMVKKEE